MSEFGEHFVVDTNVLVQVGQARRSSRPFLNTARLPEEVLRESSGLPDHGRLRGLRIPTTAEVLRHLGAVMRTLPSGDVQLVDLYKNRGTADPFVIACALVLQEAEAGYLDPKESIVVTGDRAVADMATRFGLKVIDREGLEVLLDDLETDG